MTPAVLGGIEHGEEWSEGTYLSSGHTASGQYNLQRPRRVTMQRWARTSWQSMGSVLWRKGG
jgi:hypothetical protein